MSIARFVVLASSLLAANVAQGLQVIPVPWVATDPTVPHAAYNGHATTFKAIARGGDGTYLVEWDYDGDGVYDSIATRTDRYDLSEAFTFPVQAADRTFVATLRVTSAGQTAFGSYPVRVFADVPGDFALATDRQVQVMRSVSIDDGLWFLHKQMARTGNEDDPMTGAQIKGWVDPDAGQTTYRNIASGSYLEALGRNLHFPAFPAAYLGALPDPAANAARWATDPYAEDAARLVNHLLTQASVVSVSAADEVNLVGFYPEVAASPIAGTDDGIGLCVGYAPGELTNGPLSNVLRGLAFANLTGFVAQVGDPNRIVGRRFEFIVQQLVDGLVWAQNEGGYPGSWYYTQNSSSELLGEFAGGTMDAAEALWQVERSLGSAGVIVPNFVKARLAGYISANANVCPAGGIGGAYYTTSVGVCDFGYSPAHLFTWGWLGGNTFPAGDTRLAFPSYNAMTRGQLRTWFDGSLAFITAAFNLTVPGSIGWDLGFVEEADFARTDGFGDHWTMLHWTRAARAAVPELTLYGTNDHARLFARYLVANQLADGGWHWVRRDATLAAYNDLYLGARGRAAWALLVLSRDGMAPIASATVSATSAVEGEPLSFDGSGLAGGATYSWDMGNGVVLDGAQVEYAYPASGAYVVTLTVTTAGGSSTDGLSVTIASSDVDADGLPDAWELLHFGDLAAQQFFGNPDQDAFSNVEEYWAGFDPNVWDGPGAPTLLAPACGSRMASAQPTLLVGNATHPLGSPLSYDFELYGDAAMTTLVASGQAVPAGPGYTAWQVDVPLAEDAEYFWRARAGEAGFPFSGPWTAPACAFTVDVIEGTGPTGPQGPPGADGASGADGAAGPAGADGSGCSSSGMQATWPTLAFALALTLRSRRRGAGARSEGEAERTA